eukprot:GHVS01063264.1.p1 GENE.GHVS01063264.1~~GHVS01063264.1.p1  ORF type:complete len:405 (-),score=55.03 GHVS01063264.1:921-2135(-)
MAETSSSFAVYWEKQGADKLCAMHCINSLLQGPYFTESSMVDVAQQLDTKERQLLGTAADYANYVSEAAGNAADDGNFNITVIEECLKHMNVHLVPMTSPHVAHVRRDPTVVEAFICNLSEHWFTIRKVNNTWYNLDSLKAHPLVMSDFGLSASLSSITSDGYSIHIVTSSSPLPLPNRHAQRDLRRNQMYLTTSNIKELGTQHKIAEAEDKRQAIKVAEESSEQDKSSISGAVGAKKTPHNWPTSGGIRLGDEEASSRMEDEVADEAGLLANDDPELYEAMRLSLQTSMIGAQTEEPPAGTPHCCTLQIRLCDGSRIVRRFLLTDYLTSILVWLEGAANPSATMGRPLTCYTLIIQHPRRKFMRGREGEIELVEENSQMRQDVSDKQLRDLNFHSQETLTLQM